MFAILDVVAFGIFLIEVKLLRSESVVMTGRLYNHWS